MRPTLVVFGLSISTAVLLIAQPASVRIPGVDEPPELTGEPKHVSKPPELFRQLADVFPTNEKGAVKARHGIEKLTMILLQQPDYSDGYFLRAMLNRCELESSDTEGILKDIDIAIATHAAQKLPRMFESLADHYSLRAKVELDRGHHKEALDDLEAALKQQLQDPDGIFNVSGTTPEAAVPNLCGWSLLDFNSLIKRFPTDYRPTLFRGLYYRHFMRFDVKRYRITALTDIRNAITINPRIPLIYYLLATTYSESAFWPALAGVSTDRIYQDTIQALDKAIALDPKAWQAFLERANAKLQLKHYPQAIEDYNSVIELDNKNITAYADRGNAEFEIGQYGSALSDFEAALRLETDDRSSSNSRELLYEHLGDAYTKLGMHKKAVASYSQAIRQEIAQDSFLWSLQQFRGVYPEYGAVSDDVLCHKINALFWPEYEYSVIEKQLLHHDQDWPISFLLSDLYEKRGDAYLNSGDFRRGVLDFSRIFKGIPNFADGVERWRSLGTVPAGGDEHYIDVKTMEFPDAQPARLWLKTIAKNAAYRIESYELDCKLRRLRLTSTTMYDAKGEPVKNSESDSRWEHIIPDTQGEQLYDGVCSLPR